MKIRNFEELRCWKAARELVNAVHVICENGKLTRGFTTKDQIKRAALSTMNNIAEGFARFSIKEFIRFLDITQSSAIEVKSMSYLLEDFNYIVRRKLSLFAKKPKKPET
jgi:four helix bundle protein